VTRLGAILKKLLSVDNLGSCCELTMKTLPQKATLDT
jgi:hypothetical protein